MIGVDGQTRDEQIREISAPIQGDAASPYHGKTVHYLLRDLKISTDATGALVTATGQSGTLKLSIEGRYLHVDIDTYGLMALAGATCTRVIITLPDGLAALLREPLSGHNNIRQVIVPCGIISNGMDATGYMVVEGPALVFVRRGAAFAIGDLGLYGQLRVEVNV